MVWFYCEICNKNFNKSSDNAPYCDQCSSLMTYSQIDSAEIKRRKKERTTYCSICNMMVYAVKIQDAMNAVKRKGEILIQCALKTMKKKKEREASILEAKNFINKLYPYLSKIEPSFEFICKQCWNGIKLNQKPVPIISEESKKSTTPEKFFCEICGAENEYTNKFCLDCGLNLDYLKAHYFTQEYERSRHIPAKIRYDVYMRDGGKCVMCGSTEDIQFDHIIPFSKGGSHSLENIQILCQSCNLKKSNKLDV